MTDPGETVEARPAPSDEAGAAARPAEPTEVAREVGRAVALDGSCHAVLIQLTGGAFLTGYALALGATPTVIGALAALPLMARLSQLYTSWRVERTGEWKRSVLRSGFVGRGLLLGVAVLPWLPVSNEMRLGILLALLGIAGVAGSLFELALVTWLAELVPASVRAAFFARRNRIMGIVGVSVSLGAAYGLDRWRAVLGPRALLPFAALFLVGVACGLAGLLFLRRVPAPPPGTRRPVMPRLREALVAPIRDINFRLLNTFLMVWGFGIGLAAPFFVVYMLEELRLSFFAVAALSALSTVSSSITATHWGHLADRFSIKPVLRMSTYLLALNPLLWMFATPRHPWVLIPIHVFGGMAGAAFDNTAAVLVLKLAPRNARSMYLAHYGAAYAGAQAIAPILGGVILRWTDVRTSAEVGDVVPYFVLFGLAALIRAAATPLLQLVEEHQGLSVGEMLRTLGRYRSMQIPRPFEGAVRVGYTNLARLADLVARERPPRFGATGGADASGRYTVPI